MSEHRSLRRSCLASSAAWRRQARHLQEHAAKLAGLSDAAPCLRREAAAADRLSDEWLTAAVESP